MRKPALLFLVLAALLCLYGREVLACGDFLLTGKDGAIVVNGRSMELGAPADYQITVFPRGVTSRSPAPNSLQGISWTNKYGFLGVEAIGGPPAVSDGFNEQGLSCGLLWFINVQYPTITEKDNGRILSQNYLCNYILGLFATVAEAKAGIADIPVYGEFVAALNLVPPLHVSLHDSSGNSIVMELVDGKANFYDNPNAVLTNDPPFEWQTTNLNYYGGLSNQDGPEIYMGQTIHGSGMFGLPGDSTPPSRFVRLSTFRKYIYPPRSAEEAVNAAWHILNTVDIPFGTSKSIKNGQDAYDFTFWAVVKDLKNKVMQYRSYANQVISTVDLNKLNITEGAPVNRMSIYTGTGGDMSAWLMGPKPEIKINSSSSGVVTVKNGEKVNVTVHLKAGGFGNRSAKLRVYSITSLGQFTYDLADGLWKPGSAVTFSGPLSDVSPIMVWDGTLPKGTYTYAFEVEMAAEGVQAAGTYSTVATVIVQ